MSRKGKRWECKGKVGEKRQTVLVCQVGNHEGVFPITRTRRGWACPKHERKAMERKLNVKEKERVREKSRVIGDMILKTSRAYLSAVRAPSRSENVQAEERFYRGLEELATFVIESGTFQ